MGVAPQAILLLALAALTAVALVRRHALAFVGAWLFLVLAPSSSILPIATEIAAEHRMYLPVASVIVLVVLGGYALGRGALEAWAVSRRGVWRATQIGAWVAQGAAAGALATMT